MLFQCLLRSVVRKGALKLITADGKLHVFGDGTPPQIVVKLHRKGLEWSLGFNPDLRIGEAYMYKELTMEEGNLYDFLHLLLWNYMKTGDKSPFHWFEYAGPYLLWFERLNNFLRARRNVAFHYDLPDQLYGFFLDQDRQYSCGYFTNIDNSLEQAQVDKKRHIASKLFLNRSGLKVLDIGSGWGGLGLYLAREAGCRVHGVTLSVNQHKFSQERVAKEMLSKNCHFSLRDYRQELGPYDRIVSVGMFEHVGKKKYDEFFRHVHRLLADDGVGLIHTIGFKEPHPINPFIRKHIFPGASLPTLSEVLEAAGHSGLFVTDVEILRLHYAETLKRWAERLRQHREEVIHLFGETLYRKWEYYLIGCEVSFRLGRMFVFQIQLSKQLETLPLTRSYMYDWESEHQEEPLLLDNCLEDIARIGASLKGR